MAVLWHLRGDSDNACRDSGVHRLYRQEGEPKAVEGQEKSAGVR